MANRTSRMRLCVWVALALWGPAWCAAGAAETDKTVWLDQLDVRKATTGWEKPRARKSAAGNPIRVGGKTYARGMGTHSTSRFAIVLSGGAKRFTAAVGVDDEVGNGGSVEFQVIGDGKLLWTSGKVTGRDPAKRADVKLTGVRKLLLVVTDGGDGISNDHADWADAKFEVTGKRPKAVGAGSEPVPEARPDFYVRKPTWQETMLASREALARAEAAQQRLRREARKSDPELKDFETFRLDLSAGDEPRKVKVRISRMTTLYLRAERDEKSRRGGAWVYLGEARLIAADGKATPLRPNRPLVTRRLGTRRVGDERKPLLVGKRTFERGISLNCERGQHVEAVLAPAGKYEWLEAWAALPKSRNGAGARARLIVDCQSQCIPQEQAKAAREQIDRLVRQDFQTVQAVREMRHEEKDRIWRDDWSPGDLAAPAARYARACKDAHRKAASALAKAAKTPADLRAVRGLYYLGLTAERLELARRTLAFVECSAPRPALAAKLHALAGQVDKARATGKADGQALYTAICRLRRRIILSHPLLAFDKLLINKRPPTLYSHMCDQYLGRHSRPGPGPVILENWKDKPTETVLLDDKLPGGSVLHPELSYDAKRVLFSYCDHTGKDRRKRRFFIWEIGLDGRGLRQISGTATDPLAGWGGRHTVLIEDFDPAYLPSGDIVFISTRNQGFGRCHGGRYTPSYMVYRMKPDGSDLHQISFGEANEWDPSVLPDGRIVYTRWDYINRHDTIFQSLWTTCPDGRSTMHYYGNYSRAPCMIAEARAVPGSHQVVATGMAHHSYTTGTTILIDPDRGQDGLEPLTRVTPEIAFPEAPDRGQFENGAYATPWPISEELFLVAYTPERQAWQGRVQSVNAYSIYLVDMLGGRELIYRDPNVSCFSPIPLQPRPKPPVLPSLTDAERRQKTGVFYVRNVYESTQPIPPGSIRSIRINAIVGQPTASHPQRSRAANEIVKRILGTVPVAADGSAAFRVPAGQPMQLQVLDANGMAVMTMRSLVYLQPGETAGCVGCHEPRHATSRVLAAPTGLKIHDIQPPAGPRYEGGFSFARTVQPVLDRYCIKCHGLAKAKDKDKDKPADKINLLGTRQDGFSTAYCSLTDRRDLIKIAHRNGETYYSKPKDYFAHAGKLVSYLMGKHRDKARLDRDGLQRIIDWLDVNAQFHGDYSFNRLEDRRVNADAEKALREHTRKLFGKELAEQPFAALVNVAFPDESRILKAPLAKKAGGWEQVTAGGWKSTSDPGYVAMRKLVEATIQPLTAHDVAGTCGKKNCRCGGCWVRKAEKEFKEKLAAEAAGHQVTRRKPTR